MTPLGFLVALYMMWSPWILISSVRVMGRTTNPAVMVTNFVIASFTTVVIIQYAITLGQILMTQYGMSSF